MFPLPLLHRYFCSLALVKFPIDSSIVTICHCGKINLFYSTHQPSRIGCQMSFLAATFFFLLPSLRLFRGRSLAGSCKRMFCYTFLNCTPRPSPHNLYLANSLSSAGWGPHSWIEHTRPAGAIPLHGFRFSLDFQRKPNSRGNLSLLCPKSRSPRVSRAPTDGAFALFPPISTSGGGHAEGDSGGGRSPATKEQSGTWPA